MVASKVIILAFCVTQLEKTENNDHRSERNVLGFCYIRKVSDVSEPDKIFCHCTNCSY